MKLRLCLALAFFAALPLCAQQTSAPPPGADAGANPPGGKPPLPLPPGDTPPGGQPPGTPPRPGGVEPALPNGAPPLPVQPGVAVVPPVAARTDRKPSVVRVNVTNQAWDFMRPWGKRAPFSRRGVGPVLPGNRVLVTAELVGNANYLELEAPEGGQKTPASVEAVDYEANLALLKPEDDKFLSAFEPVQFTTAVVGDTISIWQLESTGTLLVTKGSLTTTEISRYPIDESPLLVYRATASLQFRDASFTLPVAKDDKLIGIVMRYDNATKGVEIVPTPIIEHFLKDASQPPYEGFPRAGMAYSNTRDPQLRRFIGLEGKHSGGVYITDVVKGGPAETAGLKPGDVVLKIGGEPVDQDGNFTHPEYGKISSTFLITTQRQHGESVKFTVFRKGELTELEVKAAHRDVEEFVVEPYVIDRAPKFYLLGGLVLQELSRQYLKEWGADWAKKAPEDLVYYDRHQTELFREGPKKLVLLSTVLPSPATVGYEDLRQLIVTKINGVPLDRLADVPKALAKSGDGLHKLEFESDPASVYLDAAAITSGDEALMENYRIPALHRLE